jgi:hypothetical protein
MNDGLKERITLENLNIPVKTKCVNVSESV